ncbi:MAG: hypothetical protein ACTSW2_01225 [Alphaproteobacteria bacterium]
MFGAPWVFPPTPPTAFFDGGDLMAFKPNYSQSRRERDRAKAQKKQEKQQRREEATALRKAEQEGEAQSAPSEPEGA